MHNSLSRDLHHASSVSPSPTRHQRYIHHYVSISNAWRTQRKHFTFQLRTTITLYHNLSTIDGVTLQQQKELKSPASIKLRKFQKKWRNCSQKLCFTGNWPQGKFSADAVQSVGQKDVRDVCLCDELFAPGNGETKEKHHCCIMQVIIKKKSCFKTY